VVKHLKEFFVITVMLVALMGLNVWARGKYLFLGDRSQLNDLLDKDFF